MNIIITWVIGSSGHNMREIVVDASDRRISSHDLCHGGSSPTAYIHQGVHSVEAMIVGQQSLHNGPGVGGHGAIEEMIEVGMSAGIRPDLGTVGPLEGDATVQHAII